MSKEKVDEEAAMKKEGKDIDKPIEYGDYYGKEKYVGGGGRGGGLTRVNPLAQHHEARRPLV